MTDQDQDKTCFENISDDKLINLTNPEDILTFIKTHNFTFVTTGGKYRNKRGGAPTSLKICHVEPEQSSSHVLNLPNELLQKIVQGTNVLSVADFCNIALVSKALKQYAPSQQGKQSEPVALDLLFQRLADVLYNAATQAKKKTVAQEYLFSYGVRLRNNSTNTVMIFVIHVSNEKIVFISGVNGKDVSSQSWKTIEEKNFKDEILAALLPIKQELQGFPSNKYLDVAVAGGTDIGGISSEFFDDHYFPLKDVVGQWGKFKDIFAFNTNKLVWQGGKGNTTNRIFYKGYYYKPRFEGRRKFIITKHEGEVLVSAVNKWQTKQKKQ